VDNSGPIIPRMQVSKKPLPVALGDDGKPWQGLAPRECVWNKGEANGPDTNHCNNCDHEKSDMNVNYSCHHPDRDELDAIGEWLAKVRKAKLVSDFGTVDWKAAKVCGACPYFEPFGE
jgi:hypothetical protein